MKILTTLLAGVIFLGELVISARAGEAEALVPVAPGSQLSSSSCNHRPTLQAILDGTKGPQASNNCSAWSRRWAVSLAPLFASQALDAASSYGMRELNPLLASPNGSFGTKATGIKFGVIGALAGVEYFVVKKYPRSAKIFTIVNWTTAGATSGLALHNYHLH